MLNCYCRLRNIKIILRLRLCKYYVTRGPTYQITWTWEQCATFSRIGQGGPFCLLIGRKNTNFRTTFVEFWSSIIEKKLKMSQPMRDRGGLKNTNLIEDVEILLRVKFRCIPCGSFRQEVENISANQRPGRPSCFSIGPKITNLVEDGGTLRYCLPSSFVKFPWVVSEEKNRKCLKQSDARAAILFFRIGPKNTNLVEDVEILLPVKFRWTSVVSEEKSKMWKVNDGRTTDNAWSKKCTWAFG